MKILMLTASLRSGGAETHICELSRALARRGNFVCIASSGGNMEKNLVCAGVKHVKITLDSKNPMRMLSSVRKLRRLITHSDFDVIHLHSRIAAFVCRLALKKRNLPSPCVLSTVHARFRSGPLLKRLSFWGSASIAVSDDLKDHLCERYGIYRDNVTVIPNAIDTDLFSPSAKNSAREIAKCRSNYKIIFVSRLDTDCSLGASLLCRIAPRLAKKYPGITIDVLGGGRSFKKISSEARSANETLGYTAVRMCGNISDVQKNLSEADLFVGVSRAALEAMSCGLPTVLCGNEGFLGILDSSNIALAEDSNFCCRGCDLPTSESLFSSVCAILEMKESERRELGRFLREHVCRRHSLDSLAKATEELYRERIFRTPTKRASILLCGYYGFGNAGDDALLACAVERLRTTEGNNSIAVICRSPKKISRTYGIKALRRENIFAVLRAVKQADRLILGGGSILQDASSSRSLIYYTALMRYAARKGVKVELMANGLGPLKRKSSRKRASRALVLCHKLSFRDLASASLAKKLGCDEKKVKIENDLTASVIPCTEKEKLRLLRAAGCADGTPFVAVAVRGDTEKDELRRIKDELSANVKSGLTPIFIVMHAKQDKRLAKRLAKKFKGVCAPALTPSELVTLVGCAEAAIGNRYHLLYAAKRAGISVTAFGKDPKIISLRYL